MNIGDIVAIRGFLKKDHTHIGLIVDINKKSCLVMWAENNRPTAWWNSDWLEVYNATG